MKALAAIPLLLFGLLWTSFVVFFDTTTVPRVWKQIQASRFPTTTGTITRSEVVTSRGSKGRNSYRAAVAYEYEVGDKVWTSDRIYQGVSATSDRRAIEPLVKAFPAGAPVTVYYDPSAPGEAVLRPGLQPEHLFIALFMTPFHLIGLGILAGGVSVIRSAVGKVKLAVRPIDEMRMAVRMPWISPLLVGFCTLGLAAFVSIFVCAFGFGMPPHSMPPIVGTWLAVIALSLFMAGRRSYQLRAGLADLVVDAGAKTVILPIEGKRQTQIMLPFSEVSEVRLDCESRPTSKGTNRTYHLALRSGGELHRLHSSSDGDQMRAHAELLSKSFGWPLKAG